MALNSNGRKLRTKNAKRRRMGGIAVLLALVALTLFSGCGEESFHLEALTFALPQPFENNFNYFYAESTSNIAVIELVTGTLMRESPNGGYEPYLGNIEAKQEGDHLLVTVSVNKNVRFSDGKRAQIDDMLFLYRLLADPGYTGIYSDFWKSPITGLAEYYFDSPTGDVSVPDFESQAQELYAPAVISEEALKTYLIETNLNGEWEGNLDDYRGGGLTWRQYLEEEGYGERLAEVSSNATRTLELLADIYYEKYAEQYNAVSWYARKLKREYMYGVIADGVDVPEISGIQKVDDYTCTVEFYDPSADYLSILNRPLLSSQIYSKLTKGGGDNVASSARRGVPVGAGPFSLEEYADGIVTLEQNRYFQFEPSAPETIRIRTMKSEYMPLNCYLRQISAGVMETETGTPPTLPQDYQLSVLPLQGGILLFQEADADFSALLPADGVLPSLSYYFARLWQVKFKG